MHTLFTALDTLLDLPFPAFEKKLAKFEEEFRNISVSELSDDELEAYFLRIKKEFDEKEHDAAKTRLAILGYLSHFDSLVERFFPDYVTIFQSSLDRKDSENIALVSYDFLEHMEEILRDYTHRLSEPDQYPSYTNFIQELIQNSMIDLFFWLQDRESVLEKKASSEDRNTDMVIRSSSDTKNTNLQLIRQCLELLANGILEKIFFDLGYGMRISAENPDLHLI